MITHEETKETLRVPAYKDVLTFKRGMRYLFYAPRPSKSWTVDHESFKVKGEKEQ